MFKGNFAVNHENYNKYIVGKKQNYYFYRTNIFRHQNFGSNESVPFLSNRELLLFFYQSKLLLSGSEFSNKPSFFSYKSKLELNNPIIFYFNNMNLVRDTFKLKTNNNYLNKYLYPVNKYNKYKIYDIKFFNKIIYSYKFPNILFNNKNNNGQINTIFKKKKELSLNKYSINVKYNYFYSTLRGCKLKYNFSIGSPKFTKNILNSTHFIIKRNKEFHNLSTFKNRSSIFTYNTNTLKYNFFSKNVYYSYMFFKYKIYGTQFFNKIIYNYDYINTSYNKSINQKQTFGFKKNYSVKKYSNVRDYTLDLLRENYNRGLTNLFFKRERVAYSTTIKLFSQSECIACIRIPAKKRKSLSNLLFHYYLH